jgi:hypothetical protein
VPITVPPQVGIGGIRPELVVAGLALLGVLAYVVFYWRGLAAMERYTDGFVIDTCPVCRRGRLVVETRPNRFLGIPRPRTTVRCTACPSTLREVSRHHWRYSVDPKENPAMYKRYNGQMMTDATLKLLSALPPAPERPFIRPPATPPAFVDDEET